MLRSDRAPVVLSPGNVVWGSPNHTLSSELVSPWWQPGFTDKTVTGLPGIFLEEPQLMSTYYNNSDRT